MHAQSMSTARLVHAILVSQLPFTPPTLLSPALPVSTRNIIRFHLVHLQLTGPKPFVHFVLLYVFIFHLLARSIRSFAHILIVLFHIFGCVVLWRTCAVDLRLRFLGILS